MLHDKPILTLGDDPMSWVETLADRNDLPPLRRDDLADDMLGEIVLGEVMLALPAAAVDNRDVVRLGEATHPTTEPTSQTHEVRVVELLLGATHQRPPPQPKAASRITH